LTPSVKIIEGTRKYATVDDTDEQADSKTDRDRRRTADRSRYHRGGCQRPWRRKIDLGNKDHQHHAGCDDAEKGSDLQLLKEISRGDKRRTPEMLPSICRAGDQDRDNEERGDKDWPIVA
jgi:hypothetical protein